VLYQLDDRQTMCVPGLGEGRFLQRWLGHSELTTTMNVYVHELDDGLAARMRWTTFRGTRGTPNTRSHPQTNTARTATILPRKRQPQIAATPWTDA
jgi:hypothetical protein